ncbi:MAG: hypothetical protein AB9869_10065 [Verrucomicrobiia bacterium]
MQIKLTESDVRRFRRNLQRARIATVAAMQMGDCRAVARLTCEAARLQNAVAFAGAMREQE